MKWVTLFCEEGFNSRPLPFPLLWSTHMKRNDIRPRSLLADTLYCCSIPPDGELALCTRGLSQTRCGLRCHPSLPHEGPLIGWNGRIDKEPQKIRFPRSKRLMAWYRATPLSYLRNADVNRWFCVPTFRKVCPSVTQVFPWYFLSVVDG